MFRSKHMADIFNLELFYGLHQFSRHEDALKHHIIPYHMRPSDAKHATVATTYQVPLGIFLCRLLKSMLRSRTRLWARCNKEVFIFGCHVYHIIIYF